MVADQTKVTRKVSEETRKKLSLSHKGIKKDIQWRSKIQASNKLTWSDPALRAKHSLINKGKPKSLEQRKKISDTLREKYKLGLLRADHNKGRRWSDGYKAKMSYATKGRIFTEETRRKLSQVLTGRKFLDDSKLKMSISRKRLFNDPEYREKYLLGRSKFMKTINRDKPNVKEIELTLILQDMFPEQWKFVGNGDLWIGGKCPDFCNVNGDKKLIELFGRAWHKREDEQNRVNHFKKFGFDTLVIWVPELKNKDILQQKLLEFHGRK